jgi:hypothetical protein
MSRFARTIAAVAVVASAVVFGAAAAAPFPDRIDFPLNPNNGTPWAAEGIFIEGQTFYAGDTTNGAVLKGNVRTGESSILVPAAAQGTKAALGVFVDKWNRLWVAGGGAPNANERHAFVYDADTGALIKDIMLALGPFPTGSAYGIINDLTVTKDAAWFTNTNNATNPGANVLFKVPLGKHGEIGTPTKVSIPFFGANGIEATKSGKTLVIAGFTTGEYFTLDTGTNAVEKIDITENGAPASLPRGDGLILRGHTLYIVLNLPNAAVPGRCGDVPVVQLSGDMSSGQVVDHLNSAADPLVNPATADIFGKNVYVIRRNFAPPPAAPCTTTGVTPVVRWITRVDKHTDDGE